MIKTFDIQNLIPVEMSKSWHDRKNESLEFPLIEIYFNSRTSNKISRHQIIVRTSYNKNQYACREYFTLREKEELSIFCLKEYVKDCLFKELLDLIDLNGEIQND